MADLVNTVENTFYYLCRLCALKFATPGLPIFSNEGHWREIAKKIHECLNFTVEENDRCPKSICSDCVFKLDLHYEFLLKTLEAQHFLSELFDGIFIVKDETHQKEFEILELSELPDPNQPSIQEELDHLVDGAHIHADSNDITQIIQYHDSEINDEHITEINHIDNITPLPKDTYSLPDIALYSFDNISEADEHYLDNTAFTNTETNAKLDLVIKHEKIVAIEHSTVNQKLPQKRSKSIPKICTVCKKSFRTNYKLREHMNRHLPDANFPCIRPGCGKSFRSKIGLIEHEAKHTGLYKYSCQTCGKGFQIKSYLTIHLKTHSNERPYKCSTCGIMLKAKQALINHENRHLGVKPFKCLICDQRFISKALLSDHEKVYHTNNASVKKHPCPICQKQFVRRAYLKTHLTIHSGNKPFICDICGNKFLTGIDLRQHTKLHTGEKEHVCEVCGKAFTRPDSLKVHMRSHTGERPYKCIYCNQQFVQVSSMKIHIRLHTGEKPYSCDVCGKLFIAKAYLQTHLKKHDQTNLVKNDNSLHGTTTTSDCVISNTTTQLM